MANKSNVGIPEEELVREQTMAMNAADVDAPAEQAKSIEPEKPKAKKKDVGAGIYRLKALMNVRKGPSLSGEIVGTLDGGTEVKVKAVEGDWLRLADDTFIYYHDGKWAMRL